MVQKKHLIAVDLDGTLLNKDHRISEQNKNALIHAMEQGHIVVIATGRPSRASMQYYRELKLKTPMVNFNGALIHHPTDSRWKTTHSPLQHDTALKIVDACYELDVPNIMAEVQDSVFIDRYDENFVSFFQALEAEDTQSTLTIGSLRKKLTEDPTSLLIAPTEQQVELLQNELNKSHAELVEHRNWAAPWNIIEIVRKGIHKAVGLKKISNYFGIPQERIIAFGDEDNDLEMIDYAGVGVAMGNAIDELKNIAKHITDTNENSGVASFLTEYLQLKPIHK